MRKDLLMVSQYELSCQKSGGSQMQLARLQPPVALVSALCIAAVPFQDASATHALDAASAAFTDSGRTVSTWSLPYTLDAFVLPPFLYRTSATLEAAEKFVSEGFNQLGQGWQSLASIPSDVLSFLQFPNLNSARWLAQDMFGVLAHPLIGAPIGFLGGVGLAVVGVPVAFVFDAGEVILKAFFPSAAAIHPAAATNLTGAHHGKGVTVTLTTGATASQGTLAATPTAMSTPVSRSQVKAAAAPKAAAAAAPKARESRSGLGLARRH